MLWHAANAEEEGPYFRALLQGFKDIGYVEGRNFIFEHRFPNEAPERFKSMAAELVALNVDVLISVGTTSAPYAKNATNTIPDSCLAANSPWLKNRSCRREAQGSDVVTNRSVAAVGTV